MSDIQHSDLIARLGGGSAVVNLLSEAGYESVDREAVYKWKRRGVPPRWRYAVAKIAESKGVPVPDNFLDAAAA